MNADGRSPRTPKYRLHKPRNRAVVTIDGRDYYLGPYNSPESKAEYDRLIALWLANGRRMPADDPDDLTIDHGQAVSRRPGPGPGSRHSNVLGSRNQSSLNEAVEPAATVHMTRGARVNAPSRTMPWPQVAPG